MIMRLIHYSLFTVLFLLLAFLFDYHHTTFYKPQSTHTWRQADCASFSMNYYQYNRSINHPRLHNRLEGDGYMVGEFPGLYYISAQLYKVFGAHEFIPRFLNLLILFIGLMALFKMTFQITNSLFFAYIIPLLLFSAPIITYYGNNYLTDVPSFAFILMGWSSFMSYHKHEKLKSLYIAGLFFMIAGLLKITMLVSVVALGCVFLLEWFGWARFKNQEKIFKHTWHTIGVFAVVVGVVAGWYILGALFNESHHVAYFLSSPKAPWTIDRMDWFTYTIYRVLYFWSGYYFFTLTHYLIIFVATVILLGRKKINSFLYSLVLLTFFGSFMIFQLFYYQFMDHDYYVIPGYMFVIFVLIGGIMILKEHYPHIFSSWILKVATILFLVINIWHAKSSIHDRYNGKLSFKPNTHLYENEFQSYIKGIGIHEHDLVVSVPDISPNSTLYLINRPGFTEWVGISGAPLSESWMREFIKRGAEYLVVHDQNYLNKEAIQSFKENEIGDYKGIKIYDLKNLDR